MSAPIKISNEFKKKYGHEIARYRTDHLQHLDRELGSIASAISTEIMPGEADLSKSALPQRPVPKSLFPTLASNESVNFTSNPSLIDVNSTKYNSHEYV
jgi:DNA polymerase II small subunit/DNA polymerase delta subunit B